MSAPARPPLPPEAWWKSRETALFPGRSFCRAPALRSGRGCAGSYGAGLWEPRSENTGAGGHPGGRGQWAQRACHPLRSPKLS